MVKSMRINCIDSTYVDKTHSTNNFHQEEKLLAGVNYKNESNFNIYKTFLKFDTSKLNNHSIKSAFLYLFIEKIKLTPNPSDNIVISKNISNCNISTLNWINYPKTMPSNKYILNITSKHVGKYIKINITDLVDSWINNNENYGITIEPLSINYSSIIQFASNNSLKPPYLSLTAICNCKDNEYDYPIYCLSSSSQTKNDLIIKEMYDDIIYRLNIQDEKLNNLEKFINNKIDLILDNIIDTNNAVIDLNAKFTSNTIEENLIETVSQLLDGINFINIKIDDLHSKISTTPLDFIE